MGNVKRQGNDKSPENREQNRRSTEKMAGRRLKVWLSGALAAGVLFLYTGVNHLSLGSVGDFEGVEAVPGGVMAIQDGAASSEVGTVADEEGGVVFPEEESAVVFQAEGMASSEGGTMAAEEEEMVFPEEEPVVSQGYEAALPEDASGSDIPETGQQKKVALTFDDGPHPVYTKKLLDGLAERQVRATFFVIGKNIPGNEELIARMDQEGHLIGNHTYDHVRISDLSAEEACEQVEKTSDLVRAITGKNTEFVRPPFGDWNKEMECAFVMIPVLWDVDPLDWTTKNTAEVVRRVLEDVEDNDIILLHDYYESSVDAALLIVDALMEQGYTFVTVDELILE